MKLSDGYSKVVPTVGMVVLYGLSFVPLALALKAMPIGIAYAAWSALGTALIVAVGCVWFKEPVNTVKIVSLVLIVAGLVALRLSDSLS